MRIGIAVVVLAITACSSGEDMAKRKAEMDRQAKADEPVKTAPVVKQGSATPEAPKVAPPPPGPEPTTPAEIDHARNQAMIDGRDKDVLKYCEMGKLDDKSNPQALLGCVLSSCRLKDADNAKKYAKGLKKEYRDNAARVCTQNEIVL